jgi:hypothetical protein
LLAGCVAVTTAAAGAGLILLTGLFLGSIQTSLAATAHSYRYTDFGTVQLVLQPPPPRQPPPIINFTGRLPGFHIIFVTGANRGVRAAQAVQAIEYETDANIDFSADPPTITGTVRPRGGGTAFTINELYPEITRLTGDASLVDGSGRRVITIRIEGRGPDGEELIYSLVLRVTGTADGNVVDGSAQVQRERRVPGQAPEVVQGTGTVELEKQPDQPAEAPNDNVNDNGTVDGGGDGGGDEEPPPPVSACIPGLPQAAAFAVDAFVQTGGRDRVDLDADGTVTSEEVQESLDPVLEPFSLAVGPEAADCIAELLNR